MSARQLHLPFRNIAIAPGLIISIAAIGALACFLACRRITSTPPSNVADAIPNPEPASPSLGHPDPGIYEGA